jgi:hypothetical protein
MSTFSTNIKTNDIDTITATSLIVGGVTSTQVNIGSATCPTTVSGTLTANGIITPLPIILSYATVPTFTSNQIGYQEVKTLIPNSANISNNTTTVVSFSQSPSIITLGVGVWNISFGVRFVSSGSTNVTFFETYAYFSSAPFIGGFRMPQNIGLTSYTIPTTMNVTTTNNLAVNDSITITNITAGNSLTLSVRLIFTGSTIALLGSTGGSVGPPVVPDSPNTYLIATRIG